MLPTLTLAASHVRAYWDSPHTAYLTALAGETSADPIAFLVNYGLAGIGIILFVTGRIGTKAEIDRLTTEKEQLRTDLAARDEAIARLISQITTSTLPQVSEVANVMERLPAVQKADQNQMATVMDRLHTLLERLDRLDRLHTLLERLEPKSGSQ